MAKKARGKRAVQAEEKEEELADDAVAGVAVVTKFPRQLSSYSLDVRRWHEDLCNLVSDISIFTKLVSLDEGCLENNYALMDTFGSHLSPTLKEYLNMVDSSPTTDDMVIEMVIVSVEFVIGITRLVVKDHSKLPLFLKLVQIIQVVHDEENAFYKIRHGQGNKKFQIVLSYERLWRAEEGVCGLYLGSRKNSEFFPTGCRSTRWNSAAPAGC